MSRPLVLVLLVVLLAACGGAPANTPTGSPTAGAPTTPALTPTATASAVAYAGTDWSDTALGVSDRVGERFAFSCPAGGSAGVVWGTDTYTADSSVCTAAVHAGLISLASGGDVTIEVRAGQDAYTGSQRNGISTSSYPGYDSSFVFVAAGTATPAPTTTQSGTMTYEQLLTHLPPLVADCTEVGAADTGASVVAACVPEASLLGPDTESALVTYLWFDHFSKADQYFGDQLERLGDQFGEDCAVEPSHYLQEVDDEFIGRVLCAGNPDEGEAIEAFWGDLRLTVVGSITIEPGSYLDLGALLDAAQLLLSSVDQLLSHVPADYRDGCDETPVSGAEPGALVAVACPAGNPGAEIIEYVQFDSKASMDAAYQQRASAASAVPTDGDCSEGPDEDGYTIGGQPAGRAFCAAQPFGIRLDWTDDRLNILTSATDFDSSYADLHGTWLKAGPEL
jgi:hypothetical protein